MFPIDFLRVVRLRRHRRGRSWPPSARSSCCRRCWPCSATASNKCALFHRNAAPAVGEGVLAPHRHGRDAAAGAHRHGAPSSSCWCSASRSSASPSACPTTGCCPPGDRPPGRAGLLRHDFSSREAERPRGRHDRHRRPDAARRDGAIAAYAAALSQVPGVARVDAAHRQLHRRQQVAPAGPARRPLRRSRGHVVSVVPSVEPMSAAGRGRSSTTVRAVPRPGAGRWSAARRPQLVDTKAPLFAACRWPSASSWSTTFVLLFLLFGSLLVPLKARRPEHAEPDRDVRRDGVDLPGRPPVRRCSTSRRPARSTSTTPILMFCIAFGLSMDYEVFLLSRIKEEHDHGARQRHVGRRRPRAHRPHRHRRRRR